MILIGSIMNNIAIYVNHGKMPVRGRKTSNKKHKPLNKGTRMKWMCDIIGVRINLIVVNIAAMISVGDLIVFIGAGWFLFVFFRS
jgi:hypothetical protein